MKRTRILNGSLSALLLGSVTLAQAPPNEVDTHIATAKAAAGQDYRGTCVNLCLPGGGAPGGGARGAGAAPGGGGRGAPGAAPAARGAATAAPATPDRAGWYASPYKVFDNLYWLGTRQHSSWALRTSAGLILIDTNFAWATQPEIIDGLPSSA